MIRRHLSTVVVAMVTAGVTTAAPVAASTIADYARNSDKVDGKHAVGAGASIDQRAGKLVATGAVTGRLPNNIIAKAPDANRLDGLDSTAFFVRGSGAQAGFVNIDSCGSGPLVSYSVNLARAARIFAAASSGYGRSSPGPESPSIRVQLLNGAQVVADTGRDVVVNSTGNPSLSISGLLLAVTGHQPYTAAPGSYTLRVFGDNFGTCAGFGQYQDVRLSHVLLSGH